MWKKCTPLWREAHLEVKSVKNRRVRSTFGSWDVKKVYAIVARITFRNQNGKSTTCRTIFGCWTVVLCGRCKRKQNVRVLSQFQKRWQPWDIWRRSAKMHFAWQVHTINMFIRDVSRSGRLFPERGCILEHQIVRFAKIILRDRCSTLYDLASLFRGRRSTLDRCIGKIAKRIDTRPSALHSTFHFWRKSRKIVSFLMLCQLETHWGSLAEFVSFLRCQVQKLRTSRRIAAFLTMSS